MGAGAESSTLPSMRPRQLLAALDGAARWSSASAERWPLSLSLCCDAAKLAPPLPPGGSAGCAWLWAPCSAASRSSVPRNMKPALLQQPGYDSGRCGA